MNAKRPETKADAWDMLKDVIVRNADHPAEQAIIEIRGTLYGLMAVLDEEI